MKPGFTLFFALATVAQSAFHRCDAISVTGSLPGFAYGVTGGGDATHLIVLLGSDESQVIIIDRTYDFIGTEGTTREPFARHGDPLKMDSRLS